MTQIITGGGLGVHGSSLGQLGGYGLQGIAALGQGGESVYVNVANGNLVLRQSDGFLATAGSGINLVQTYNSLGDSASQWCFNVQTRLIFSGTANQAGSSVIRVDEDGHQSEFRFDANRQCYLPSDGSTASLRYDARGWHYREGSSERCYEYNAEGQLTALTDSDGHAVVFEYRDGKLASLRDNSGKQTVCWTFEDGLLRDIKAVSEGQLIHHLHYEYDAHQRLQKVSRDLGDNQSYWIAYDYLDDSGLVTGIRQSDGTSLRIEYDSEGRVKLLCDGEGRVSRYDYLGDGTRVTNGSGESWLYRYDEQSRLIGIDGPQGVRSRYYYEGQHLVGVDQGNLHWRFRYNETGDCIETEEPSGQLVRRTFDSEHRLLTETRYQVFDGMHHPAKPQTRYWLYDERGHLRFQIAADGSVSEYRYNQEGQKISCRYYLRAGFEHNALDTQRITLQDLTSWVSRQNAQAISLVAYHYDWRGQLTEEIHYTHINAAGEGVSEGAVVSRSCYDAAGRLIVREVPVDGRISRTCYAYDGLGRLIQTTDNQEHKQSIAYDAAHQRIIQTDANGLITVHTYDHSGLLLATQYADSTHVYGQTLYRYDKAGRLQSETSPTGQQSYFFYDQAGRLQAKVAPGGLVSEYRYDEEGRLLQTIDYAQVLDTRQWQSGVPEFATIRPKSSDKDRISQTIYNAFNQVAYRIDAQGAVVAYDYDADGRVIKKTAFANRLSGYWPHEPLAFDAILPQTSSNDRTQSYIYDSQGRLQAEVDGEGAVTAYRYDRQGHLLESCRYFNRVNCPITGDWEEPSPTGNDIHTYHLYNAAGLEVATIDAEGYVTEFCYDERGLLVEKRQFARALRNPVIGPDSTLDDIRPQQSVSDQVTCYCYNDLNQLIEEQSPTGLLTSYRYDAAGLMIEKTAMDLKTHEARQQCYRYDAMGRLVQSLDAAGAALIQAKAGLNEAEIDAIWQQHGLHYTYDPAGRLIAKTNALKQTTRYVYDEAGYLVYTISAEGEVTENQYNAFHQVTTTVRYSQRLQPSYDTFTCEALAASLASLADTHHDEVSQFEYDTLGRMIKKTIGHQGETTLIYNAFGELDEQRQRLDASHESINRYHYDHRGLLYHTLEDATGIARTVEARYDVFGRLEQVIGGPQSQHYRFNKRGEVLAIFSGDNERQGLRIEYDAFGRMVSESGTDRVLGRHYQYDTKNNSITIMTSGRGQVINRLNAFGDILTTLDGNKQETRYTYDADGQLVKVEGPEGKVLDYRYDAAGHLTWQQEAGGETLAFTYDAQGRLLTKTIDPEGLNLTTTYRYDGIGRQLEVIEANGLCKQFSYDAAGRLVQTCIDPDGLQLVTSFSYDERGLLLNQTEHNPGGKDKVTAYEWDALGRRTATILDPEGLKLTSRYDYDEYDNLIATTDANNQSSHFVYDANHRCRYQIDPRGVVTEHRYDALGNEYRTIRYANRIDSLSDYSEGALASVLQPDGADQYEFRDFDGAGRLRFHYDALGFATGYVYDGNDNVIRISHYAHAISLDLLKAGRFPFPESEGSREEYLAYDGLNRLCYQMDSVGSVTAFHYDEAGHLTASTRYAKTISPAYCDRESIEAHLIADEQDQTTHYAYDKAGRLIASLSPGGIATGFCYDKLGHQQATIRYAVLFRGAEVNEEWQTRLTASNEDRITRFIYDSAGREIYRISPEGRVMKRRYDAVGNVVAEVAHQQRIQLGYNDWQGVADNPLDRVSRYTYDALGRLLAKIEAGTKTTSYAYDGNDNLISKTEANQAVWRYEYDQANQLVAVHSPVTTITSHQGAGWQSASRSVTRRNVYDSFGNLITCIEDAEGLKQTTHYSYDANNRKIKTSYPGVMVSQAGNQASSSRQELAQMLTEEIRYNAFGEMIACSDRAGNWRHWVYDFKGQVLFSINAEGELTGFKYDNLGNLSCETHYANRLLLANQAGYTEEYIAKVMQPCSRDREESCYYDKDNRLIERSRKAVLSYDAKTNRYETLTPLTRLHYNAFGEVIRTSVRRHEADWMETYCYYDRDGQKTAVVDAEGYLTAYGYDSFGELASETQFANRLSQWNKANYQAASTSSGDRTVCFEYDALGQLTSKTLKQVSYQRLTSAGNRYETLTRDLTTRFTYNAMGQLTSTTDAQGNTAYCYYNSLGQLTAKVGPAVTAGRSAITYGYDALGRLVETKRWANGASLATPAQFKLKGASNADITTHTLYDSQGQVISEIDGLNHAVNYSYDANGKVARSWQVSHQIDGGTVIEDKRYRYDREGRLLSTATFQSNGRSLAEEAVYNAFGEVTAKGINGQLTTHVDYDTAGRVWRSNAQGHYEIYVYDLLGQLTQLLTSTNAFRPDYEENGIELSAERFERAIRYDADTLYYDLTRQNYVYDKLGHLLSQTQYFTENSSTRSNVVSLKEVTQSQTVDRWGNLLSHRSARGYETRYEYNAFNQVVKQILPQVNAYDEQGVAHVINPVQYFAYDALGQAIAMQDANGHTVAKVLDAEGHVISEIDARGIHRDKDYDLLGRLISVRNESSDPNSRRATNYVYDSANRLVEIINTLDPAKQKQRFKYDEAGHLIQQTKADESVLYWYDSLGRQVKRRDANGKVTSMTYDEAGHKILEEDALGNQQTWMYDTNGRLKQHTDLGGHTSQYSYNQNGLLLSERSSAGKSMSFHYNGNGELLQFVDNAQGEVVDFAYDEEGHVVHKSSSSLIKGDDGWLRENDVYTYDALGRLTTVERHRPEDSDNRFPPKDNTLLTVAYQYDAIGNIRHTQMTANYSGYQPLVNDEYYRYDENDRLLVNKGQLIQGKIQITASQGSQLEYDDLGNIVTATAYENGYQQTYTYHYNRSNQLIWLDKNGKKLRTIDYDNAGRVTIEQLFNTAGKAQSINRMTYEKGVLTFQQQTIMSKYTEVMAGTSAYLYDEVGNLKQLTQVNYLNGPSTQVHYYCYDRWDSYQQSTDTVLYSDPNGSSSGLSARRYDVNGHLKEVVDTQVNQQGQSNSSYYWTSALDGIRAKRDKRGQTSYLTVAGKTIADLQLENNGKQQLTIYGGFTPEGSQQKNFSESPLMTLAGFLQRAKDPADGTLPNAPQEFAGDYILQAGDTLRDIALTVYGDSSLWYLIADANGITDAQASVSGGQLHAGQRLMIPPAVSAHQTSNTHAVLHGSDLFSDSSATAPIPPAPPPPPSTQKKKQDLLAKVVVAVVATVATVLTAGAIASVLGAGLGGLGGGLSSILDLGLGTLAGGTNAAAGLTSSGLLAAAFGGGFVGSLAGQGAANATGLQSGIDWKGALISGLTTAASAGLLRGVASSVSAQNLQQGLQAWSTDTFSVSSAAQMMAQDALSQGIGLSLRKHQHFDWLELGTRGLVGGLMGSQQVGNISREAGQPLASFIRSQASSLLSGSVQAAASGSHFDAGQVLADNLGDALGDTLVQTAVAAETESPTGGENQQLQTQAIEEDSAPIEAGSYCPIPTEGDMVVDPEPALNAVYNNYLAKQLEEESYQSLQSSVPSLTEDIDTLMNSKHLLEGWQAYLANSRRQEYIQANQQEKEGWNIGSRLMGGLRVVEGLVEMTGAALMEEVSVGTATVPALAIGLHGSDNVLAGARQIWSGYYTKDFTASTLTWLGLSEHKAAIIDEGLSLFSGASIAHAARYATATTKSSILNSLSYTSSFLSGKWAIGKHSLNTVLGGTSAYLSAKSTADEHPWRSAIIGAFVGFVAGVKSSLTFKGNIRRSFVAGSGSNFLYQATDRLGEEKKPISLVKVGIAGFSTAIAGAPGGLEGMNVVAGSIIGFGPGTVINKLGDEIYEHWHRRK
ncbi:hypothetical protein [Legionella sp. PL877]|uniref:hypothetical protein n=1 Tax=Legionella sp. PL877 TaxID=3046773 RepID=UPI0024B80317|nr:hypothetical protein [Legionella sp. PL877]MDI9818713.1 hypothetical protein [Legionella sp. PL877]